MKQTMITWSKILANNIIMVNKFIISIFSVLLILSVISTAFLGYQTFQLRKEVTLLQTASPSPIIIPEITHLELSQGWYWGYQDQKKPGTPNNWIYEESGRSSCWHEVDIICGSTNDYQCPTTEWINCMPGPDNPELKLECTSEYLEWAQLNCPDFQGGVW